MTISSFEKGNRTVHSQACGIAIAITTRPWYQQHIEIPTETAARKRFRSDVYTG
jgi:hypothetical protein